MISMLGPLLGALLLDESRDDLGTLRELRGRVGVKPQRIISGGPRGIIDRFSGRWPDKLDEAFGVAAFIAQQLRIDPFSTEPSRADVLFEWALDRHGLGIVAIRATDYMAIRDWWDAVHPDLGRFPTIDSAVEASRDWHQQLARKLAAAGGKAVPPGEVIYRWDDGWTVHHLMTPDSLVSEGRSMQHCLAQGAYEDTLVEGRHEFFSLRKPPVPGGWAVPVTTLTWNHGVPSWEMLAEALEADGLLEAMALYAEAVEPEMLDTVRTVAAEYDAAKEAGDQWAHEYVEELTDAWAGLSINLPAWVTKEAPHLLADLNTNAGWIQIRGRQNNPPEPDYQRRLVEFMRHWMQRVGLTGPATWSAHPAEVAFLLRPEDPEFEPFWTRSWWPANTDWNHRTSKRDPAAATYDTWAPELRGHEPWWHYLGGRDNATAVATALLRGNADSLYVISMLERLEPEPSEALEQMIIDRIESFWAHGKALGTVQIEDIAHYVLLPHWPRQAPSPKLVRTVLDLVADSEMPMERQGVAYALSSWVNDYSRMIGHADPRSWCPYWPEVFGLILEAPDAIVDLWAIAEHLHPDDRAELAKRS